MKKADTQIAYVITDSEYRGKALAAHAIINGLKYLKTTDVKDVWYVTSEDNTSSIKLCTKLGFEFMGFGIRKYILKFLRILQLNTNKI